MVDVSSFLFRAFFAIRPLSNKAGLPTNALYGLLTMCLKLLNEEKPELLAFCLDSKEKNFRHTLYSEYKANRSEMPEELAKQMPYVEPLIEALGAIRLKNPGAEADDLIGTLTVQAEHEDCQVVIVSGDKDFAQLVDHQVTLYDTMKNERYTPQKVFEKWGVRPNQFNDYLALVGDSSDNIPGVAGIGPKGACKLLEKFGSLDQIYQSIDSVTPEGVRNKLIVNKEVAFLSQTLSRIATDIPVPTVYSDLHYSGLDWGKLEPLLELFEFSQLLQKLRKENEAKKTETVNINALNTEVVKNEPSHQQALISIPNFAPGASASSEVSADMSTFKTKENVDAASKSSDSRFEGPLFKKADQIQDIFRGSKKIGLLPSFEHVFVFNETTYGCTSKDDQQLRAALLKFKGELVGDDLKSLVRDILLEVDQTEDLFTTSQTTHDGQPKAENALASSFEFKWGDDLALMAYVLNPGERDIRFLSEQGFKEEDLKDEQKVSQSIQAFYRKCKELYEELKIQNREDLYNSIEKPLSKTLLEMELRGIKVDALILKKQSELCSVEIQAIEKLVQEEVGEVFSLSSPKQLSKILFEKLQMPVGKKTKTGYSTDSDVLQKLAQTYPLCLKILEHRELSKLKSTYLDSLPELINALDGRIHTHYNQVLTATGRLSSYDPNLQNIPIRTRRGNDVRKAFVADKNKLLISADYSQVELRILAHVAEDKNMIQAFLADQDIHQTTAAEVFGIPLEAVTPDQRRVAKEVNFGIAYGMGVFGLAENLGLPRKEAQEIINRYFDRFQGVKNYMSRTVEEAREKGYVETLFGRRRYLPELKSKNGAVQKFGERAAINAPIQGTAADLIKIAMVKVSESKLLASSLLLQIHDELILEVDPETVQSSANELQGLMSGVADLKVPLKTNVAWGKSWFESHP